MFIEWSGMFATIPLFLFLLSLNLVHLSVADDDGSGMGPEVMFGDVGEL
jgi:hypothetical protein